MGTARRTMHGAAQAVFPLVERATAYGNHRQQDLRDAESAAWALRNLKWYPSDDEAGARYLVLTREWKQVSSFGEAAVRPLIDALWAPDPYKQGIRQQALTLLGQIRDRRAVEPLLRLLNDENEESRPDVVRALGQIGDPQAVEPLLQALYDKDEKVRVRVPGALGRIGDRRAVQPLITVLQDKNETVRQNAAFGLGLLKILSLRTDWHKPLAIPFRS